MVRRKNVFADKSHLMMGCLRLTTHLLPPSFPPLFLSPPTKSQIFRVPQSLNIPSSGNGLDHRIRRTPAHNYPFWSLQTRHSSWFQERHLALIETEEQKNYESR